MIERIVSQIIRELGATGILVMGLYFAISIPLNKIASKLDLINKDNFPSKESISICAEKICETIRGKD